MSCWSALGLRTIWGSIFCFPTLSKIAELRPYKLFCLLVLRVINPKKLRKAHLQPPKIDNLFLLKLFPICRTTKPVLGSWSTETYRSRPVLSTWNVFIETELSLKDNEAEKLQLVFWPRIFQKHFMLKQITYLASDLWPNMSTDNCAPIQKDQQVPTLHNCFWGWSWSILEELLDIRHVGAVASRT